MGNRLPARLLIAACTIVLVAGVLAGCGSGGDDSSSTGSQIGDTISIGEGSNDADVDIKPTDPNDQNNDTNSISLEPPPVEILTGDFSGIHVTVPTVMIAHTLAARKALFKRHFSHGVKVDPHVASTNFKDRQLVGVFFPKSPRGTLAIVADVHQEGKQAVVTVVKLTKGKGCKTSGPSPRPFHVVETRKMNFSGKPVVRIDVQPGSDC